MHQTDVHVCALRPCCGCVIAACGQERAQRALPAAFCKEEGRSCKTGTRATTTCTYVPASPTTRTRTLGVVCGLRVACIVRTALNAQGCCKQHERRQSTLPPCRRRSTLDIPM